MDGDIHLALSAMALLDTRTPGVLPTITRTLHESNIVRHYYVEPVSSSICPGVAGIASQPTSE